MAAINYPAGAVQLSGSVPKYRRIADLLRQEVESGKLQPGERLPSFTEMRQRHGAPPTMMNQVYGILERDGLIERRPGSGVYVAQSRRRATGSIGFLGTSLPNRARHPYLAHLLEGVRYAAHRADREVLLMDAGGQTIRWEKVDAVLGFGSDLQSLQGHLPPGIAGISLLSPAAGLPCVMADDFQAGYLATIHLLRHGHRRIGYLRQERGISSQQRLAGYTQALLEHGIKPRAQWLRPMSGGNATASVSFQELGRANMTAWLNNGWDETGCSALLTQNDDAAIGTIEALHAAGLSVPADVSVVGFDGTEVADYFRPRLTTIVLPLFDIGCRAIEVLQRRMQNLPGPEEKEDEATIILPVTLKAGESTAPITESASGLDYKGKQ